MRSSRRTAIVFGVEKHLRETYKVWEEGGILPSIVFEITSKKTRKEDVQTKRPLYEHILYVPEYYLFDPRGDYLKPRLQGFHLVEGQYMPRLPIEGRLHSKLLDLDMGVEGDMLRFYSPHGERLRTLAEEKAIRIAEARRADAEARRAAAETQRADVEALRANAEAHCADVAEAELARLRAELEALRRQSGETGDR